VLVVDRAQVEESLARRFEMIRPHLDERQRRVWLGTEALALGRGGTALVAQATGTHPDTVAKGRREAESPDPPDGRIRRSGAGRKSATDTNPELRQALLALVAPATRGDPESTLVWTSKSTVNLANELTRQGHPVSATTVGLLLKAEGYSLQANAKTIEGRQHPDRDAQFTYINAQVAAHTAAGCPVISVDAKRKNSSAATRTAAGSTPPVGIRCGSTPTTSPTKNWARRCRTGYTTCPPTPAG
jgi:Rhodopirellula transposase DDE domain